MDNILMGALALLFFAVAMWFQRHAPADSGVVGVGQAVTHQIPSVAPGDYGQGDLINTELATALQSQREKLLNYHEWSEGI